jgi:hypothetical protein
VLRGQLKDMDGKSLLDVVYAHQRVVESQTTRLKNARLNITTDWIVKQAYQHLLVPATTMRKDIPRIGLKDLVDQHGRRFMIAQRTEGGGEMEVVSSSTTRFESPGLSVPSARDVFEHSTQFSFLKAELVRRNFEDAEARKILLQGFTSQECMFHVLPGGEVLTSSVEQPNSAGHRVSEEACSCRAPPKHGLCYAQMARCIGLKQDTVPVHIVPKHTSLTASAMMMTQNVSPTTGTAALPGRKQHIAHHKAAGSVSRKALDVAGRSSLPPSPLPTEGAPSPQPSNATPAYDVELDGFNFYSDRKRERETTNTCCEICKRKIQKWEPRLFYAQGNGKKGREFRRTDRNYCLLDPKRWWQADCALAAFRAFKTDKPVWWHRKYVKKQTASLELIFSNLEHLKEGSEESLRKLKQLSEPMLEDGKN